MHADELTMTFQQGNSLDIRLHYRPDEQDNWASPPAYMSNVIIGQLARTFINRMAIDEMGDTRRYEATVRLATGQQLAIVVSVSSNLDRQLAQALFELAVHNLQTAVDNGSIDPAWVSHRRVVSMSKPLRWKLPCLRRKRLP